MSEEKHLTVEGLLQILKKSLKNTEEMQVYVTEKGLKEFNELMKDEHNKRIKRS